MRLYLRLSLWGHHGTEVLLFGASIWPCQRPTILFFSSSTTAHLAGKGFSENGGLTRNLTGGLIAVVPVADIPNYRRGRFNRLDQSGVLNDRCQNSPGLLFWAGRVAVTSLTALPTFWFSFGQNDRHFLALYIKTVGVDKKALRPTMVSKIHLRFSTSEEGLII